MENKNQKTNSITSSKIWPYLAVALFIANALCLSSTFFVIGSLHSSYISRIEHERDISRLRDQIIEIKEISFELKSDIRLLRESLTNFSESFSDFRMQTIRRWESEIQVIPYVGEQ